MSPPTPDSGPLAALPSPLSPTCRVQCVSWLQGLVPLVVKRCGLRQYRTPHRNGIGGRGTLDYFSTGQLIGTPQEIGKQQNALDLP
eukprot:3498118-Rhodomonas_salina.2